MSKQVFSHEYVAELEGRLRNCEKRMKSAHERIDELEQLQLFDGASETRDFMRLADRPGAGEWKEGEAPF